MNRFVHSIILLLQIIICAVFLCKCFLIDTLYSILDDHSRVILTPIPNFDEFSHDYINASFIEVSSLNIISNISHIA